MDYRTLLAAVLGVGLGIVFVVSPATIVKIHTTGRRPRDQHGEWGGDDGGFETYHRLVQGIGVVVILFGLYFGATLAM
jgi:hypothetical protein